MDEFQRQFNEHVESGEDGYDVRFSYQTPALE